MLRLGSLANLDPDLFQLVDWGAKPGRVPFSVAAQLVRISNPSDRRAAILASIEYNMTKEEARQLKQAYQRGGGRIEEAISAALKTRPKVERREVILGAITEKSVEDTIRNWNSAERQQRLAKILKNHFATVSFLASNLSPSYFSLVLDSDNAKRLRGELRSEPLENKITTALAEGTDFST